MNPVFAAGALIAVGAALIPVGYKYVYQPLVNSVNPEPSNAISDAGGRYDLVAQQDEDEEALSIQTKVEMNRSDKAYDYQQLTSEAPASHYGHFDRSKYNQTPQSPAGETFLQVGAPVQKSPYTPVHHDQVALEDVIQQALTKQKQASPSSPATQKAPKINEQYLTSYQQYTPSIVSNSSVTVSSSSMSYRPAPLPEEDEEQIEVVEATVVSEVTDEEPNIGKFVLAAKQEQIQRALETSQEVSVVEEVEIVEEVNLSKFQDSEVQEPAPVSVQEEAVVVEAAPSESSILDKFVSSETTETSESKEEAPAEEINLDKFGSQEQSAPQPAAVEETPVVEAVTETEVHTTEPVTEVPAEEIDVSKFTQEETQPAVVAEEPKPVEVAAEEVQAEPVDISKFSEEAVPSTSTEAAPAAQETTEAAQEPEKPEEEQPAEQEAEVTNPVPSSSQKKKKKNNKKNKKK